MNNIDKIAYALIDVKQIQIKSVFHIITVDLLEDHTVQLF